MRHAVTIAVLLSLNSFTVNATEKHHEDPTRIVTKVGLTYSESIRISGSIGLDDTRMINVRTDLEGEEWRIGGSLGSDDYSGYWYGAGISHKFSNTQSFNLYGYVSDDSFGDNSSFGGSYTYEF